MERIFKCAILEMESFIDLPLTMPTVSRLFSSAPCRRKMVTGTCLFAQRAPGHDFSRDSHICITTAPVNCHIRACGDSSGYGSKCDRGGCGAGLGSDGDDGSDAGKKVFGIHCERMYTQLTIAITM